MPIGGANLPIDVASVPLELDQVQVDHAIAKITEQEEVTIDPGTTQSAADPAIANALTEDSNSDARLNSPQVKGEFKTTTHVLKKKVKSKRTYKCGVCGTRKPSM